ncbi:MAG: putative N-acetylmannosamine-6-phosphate 2-epimerase [Candidatus Eremiobacteraeota bacterium]|nr:putative N-acetylmannosamine-6-phosphate 2-epimerase [Candidatus Eremiobacteraeota bacterium]
MISLESLRGALIVSVQAKPGSALDDPAVIAALAFAAQEGGAAGLRIQSAAHIRAVKARCTLPVIGLVKREYRGFEPYITPTLREVGEILEAGAEIVAFDATLRERPEGTTLEAIVATIHAASRRAMADCATFEEARMAHAHGADILATTLCGYTPQSSGSSLPALALVAGIARLGSFTICEGGIGNPEAGGAALRAGADAIVVGTALTGLSARVGEFAAALKK